MDEDLAGYFGDLIRARVDDLWDDPCVNDNDSLMELQEEVSLLKAAAVELHLDFNQLVEEETTAFEQARMETLLKASKWNDSIWDLISL